MIDDVEIHGKWFLPINPRRKIRGTLRYTPSDGARLSLDEFLFSDESVAFSVTEPDFILGVSMAGEKITLYKCSGVGSAFRAYQAFVGDHFTKQEQMSFRFLTLEYIYLEEWADLEKLWYERIKESKDFIVRYKYKDPLLLAESEDYKVHLGFGYSLSMNKKFGMDIDQNCQIFIEFSRRTNIEDCLSMTKLIQNFISLALLRPSGLKKFQCFKDNHSIGSKISLMMQPVGLVYDEDSHRYYDKLFSLSDVRNDVGDIIKNWIGKLDLLSPVYNLYFSVLQSSFMYEEHKFLNYAQALETYHRRAIGGIYQEKEEYIKGAYKQLINSLPHDMESDFKKSVSSMLRYAYQYSFRKRIRELINNTLSCLPDDLVIDNNYIEIFVEKIVSTRNWLTHHDDKGKAVEGSDLYYLSLWLKMIIEVSLLKEIGFESHRIKLLLSRSQSYKRIQHFR